MTRREYPIRLIVNNRTLVRVVIDSHYEDKHKDSINDEIILELVNTLSGGQYEAEPKSLGGRFEYYTTDVNFYGQKRYRLVWLLEKEALYIGVVNAYRRRK